MEGVRSEGYYVLGWTERGWVCGIGMRKRLILFQKPCFYFITDRVLSRGAIAGFLQGILELDIIQDKIWGIPS
ncbi:MAG TPA: hypothetical protein DEG17_20205 [Cyanobacteria bacterium UBA11149]|nr:hypothetical protein [Cyanobacteria bacterium UBA11153]HBW91121.1 hypothetical protein [Cyanobacteria bacterium UBA11149]